MRPYGKVHSTFWSSATINALSDDGKLLALYLMTSPHSTIAGVFRLPDGYVSEDMKWDSVRVAQGFAELLRNGFANRCETTKWVWVTKHLEWNQPENPNQRKAAAKVALSVPDQTTWKLDFMRVCGPLLNISESPVQPKNDNRSETLEEGFPNQEQEQEQKNTVAKATGADAPDPIFGDGLSYLVRCGVPEKGARSFLGKMRKELKDDLVAVELIVKAQQQEVLDPVSWLRAAAKNRIADGRTSTGVAL